MTDSEFVTLGEEYDYIPDGTLKAFRRMARWWAEKQADSEDEADARVSRACSQFLRYMDEVRNEDGSPGISRRDIREAREVLDARDGMGEGDSLAPAPLRALDIVYENKDRTRVSLALTDDALDYIDSFGEAHGLTRAEAVNTIVALYREVDGAVE